MKAEENLEEDLLSRQQREQSEIDPKMQRIKEQYFSRKHYLFGDNPFQTLFFTWITPLLRYGFRFTLDEKCIPHLKDEDKPKLDFTKLSLEVQTNVRADTTSREGLPLTKSCFRAFKKQFALVFLMSMLVTGSQMYSPILSHDIIEYIDQQDRNFGTGFLFFGAVVGICLVSSIVQTFLWYYFAVLGFNLANTLSLLIYNKALKHPLVSEKQFAIADIINYSQVDAQRMTYLGFQLVCLIYTPIQITIGFLLLYSYIGPSFLVGMAVMFVLMLFTLVFSKIAAKGNDQLLKAKDSRMKITEQILQIIKYIKISSLEKYFFRKLNAKREHELKFIKKVNLCYVASIFIYWLCPPMIVSFTFLVFVSLGNDITPAKAFFTIIIFNILQYPIRLLPSAISQIIQIWSSIKRIQKFLKASEIKKDCIKQFQNKKNEYAIEIENGNFMWGKEKQKQQDKKQSKSDQKEDKKEKMLTKQDSKTEIKSVTSSMAESSEEKMEQQMKQSLLSQSELEQIAKQKKEQKDNQFMQVLHNINLKFPSKQVTMIIGDIGSGKSSLLYAILNQMTPEPGKDSKISIYGSVAYSAQKAWIMAGSLKDNITFCLPYDKNRFEQAIYYACLEDDIKILSKGIETEIGEKGANLSGGQKARVSLARALYSNRDIYLLDDILSAVDVHVGNFIMEKTIREYLKGKTVIMPTHAVKYLDHADCIVIMNKGKVIGYGPYQHVSDYPEFMEIMKAQKSKETERKASKEEEKIVNQLKLVKDSVKSKQKMQNDGRENNQPASITDKIVDQLIMPEDQKKGEVTLKVYMDYVKLNGGPLFLLSVIFCMGTWTSLSVYSNIQIERWCEDEDKSKKYLYLFLVLAISATFFSGARAFILITSGIRQGRIIHKKMIKSLLYASITHFYNRVPIGRILNRLSKDLREIDEAIGYVVGGTFVCFFSMLADLTMCVYASTPFVLIPIAVVGLSCRWFLRYYLKSQRQCVRLENVSSSPIVSGFTSTVNGLATIRAYGLANQFLNSQIDRIDVNKRMRISREAMESWFSLRLALLSFLINLSALAYSILSSNENASLVGLLLTYASILTDDIIGFSFSYANLELKMISVERVMTFTQLEPEPGYIEYCKGWRTKEEGANINAIQVGEVQFRNYSTRYREGLPLVLKNISLKISQGQKVGVVGRTGAGKSTFINCLLRILDPVEGEILIDGKAITDYPLKDLRACITMIEQEPTLINGSFKQNLDPSNMYSDEDINKVLDECNLVELVKAKGGIDAKITNENLSVGEKQLLCICRAFLKKSRIILIDEATANIDVRNDKLIQEVIAKVFKDSTVITIAHRLSTLKNSDQILVLSEGKVAEWGQAAELRNKSGGLYKKMCDQNDSAYLI